MEKADSDKKDCGAAGFTLSHAALVKLSLSE
jgi:hypothetical protein